MVTGTSRDTACTPVIRVRAGGPLFTIFAMHTTGMKNFATLALTLAVIAGTASWGCGRNSDETAADRVRVSGFRGVTMDSPVPKVDFTLDDTNGQPFDFVAET